MRAGCIASLASWAVLALLIVRPTLWPIVVVVVAVVVIAWTVRDPDWPLY